MSFFHNKKTKHSFLKDNLTLTKIATEGFKFVIVYKFKFVIVYKQKLKSLNAFSEQICCCIGKD
jgi:hypothetical protein